MSEKILTLVVKAVHDGEFLIVNSPRVYFAITVSGDDLPGKFDPEDVRWEVHQSYGDRKKTNELFNRLQEVRVCGRSLPEYIAYDGISLWQFLPSYVWPYFYWAVQLIDSLSEIIDETMPSLIRIFPVSDHTDPIWRGTVRAVAKARGIRFVEEHLGVRVLWRGWRWRMKRALFRTEIGCFAIRIYRVLSRERCFLKIIMNCFYHGSANRVRVDCVNSKKNGQKALFATMGRRHWVDAPGNEVGKYDEQCYPILKALQRKNFTRFVLIDCQNLSEKELKRRNNDVREGFEVKWRSYVSYRALSDGAGVRVRFAHMWKMLKQDSDFLRDFQYNGVCLMPSLEAEIRKLFYSVLPECVYLLAAAGRMLTMELPDVVLATYESGPWERALIIKAGQRGIPTVGLQHGMIFDNNADYMHDHITVDPVSEPNGFMVPKVTCVWGDFWKENLTRVGHYPRDSVRVTGNWRYDRIFEDADKIDISVLKRKYGVAAGNKVVLILTAVQNSLQYLSYCISVISVIKDCSILVKLHPTDNRLPVQKILGERNCSLDVLLVDRLDEALMVADLVISQISTTVCEAVLMDKPVILVNFQNIAGWEAYVSFDICAYVDKVENLSDAIERGLNDVIWRDRMKKARKEFIKHFYFDAGGVAADNVASVVSNLCCNQ